MCRYPESSATRVASYASVAVSCQVPKPTIGNDRSAVSGTRGIGSVMGRLSPRRRSVAAVRPLGGVAQRTIESRTQLRQRQSGVGQDLGGEPLALADQREQDVLTADLVVVAVDSLPQRQLQHLLRTRRDSRMPSGAHRLPPAAAEQPAALA